MASVVDIGTRFEVWLPCLSTVPSGENAPPSFGDGETVLLVRYDTTHRLAMRRSLRHLAMSRSDTALALTPVPRARHGHSDSTDPEGTSYGSAGDARIVGATAPGCRFRADPAGDSRGRRYWRRRVDAYSVADVVPWPIGAAETIAASQDRLGRSLNRHIRCGPQMPTDRLKLEQ